MSDNVTAIKGFADLFSPDSDAFTHMEAVARETFSRYGFTELRTPILERTELFCRGIGTETDVVQKEMYTFPDRKGRSLTLRPEATAGVMRAYIESGRSGDAVTKLFTIGPMFRYERPQKGRMRQFHQINCECLGPSEPYADAELVTMAMRFLEALGLKDLSLQLNSLGCPTCRPAYRETLRKWLSELDESALCEDCRRRMVTNPLRVRLDQPVGLRAMPAVPFSMLFQQRHGRKQQKFHLAARGALANHPRGDHPGIVGYEQRALRQIFEQMGKMGMYALPGIAVQHEKPRRSTFTGMLGYTLGRQFITIGRKEKIGFGLLDGIH